MSIVVTQQVTVTLTEEQVARCKEWGRLRTEENKGGRDIADYDPRRFNLTPLQNNQLAMLVEHALYNYQGFDPEDIAPDVWNPFVKKSQYGLLKQPDIAGKFEARRANVWGNPVPVRKKDVKANAFVVQGFVKYEQKVWLGPIQSVSRDIILTGWVDAVEDYDKGTTPGYSKSGNTVQIAMSALRPMSTLDNFNGVMW